MGPAPDMDTMDDVEDDVNNSDVGSDITLPDSSYEDQGDPSDDDKSHIALHRLLVLWL